MSRKLAPVNKLTRCASFKGPGASSQFGGANVKPHEMSFVSIRYARPTLREFIREARLGKGPNLETWRRSSGRLR